MSKLLFSVVIVGGLIAGTYVLLGIVGKQPVYSRRPRWQKHLPLALLLGAVACVVLAFAQFRVERTATQGTVILTVDASNSMDRQDVAPNRLTAATQAARAFIGQLPEGFPVGLVSFADEPTLVSPPTLDHELVDASLDSLPRGKGTVIGDGLTLSLDTLEADIAANGDRPTAVVLLSDGNDTGSAVAPLTAADRAATLAIPVYTVVLGVAGEERGADAALLTTIAETTGGTVSTAGTSGELTAVYEELGSQLSTDLAIGGTGPLFVIAGAILAAAAGIAVLIASRSSY
ncbi:MAG TPA: VWA domain-containing protein [Actinomycetota bacterium]